MTENEVFEGIHKDCGSLEICNYKETGCGDCLIRQTLIKAEEALEKVQALEAIGTIEEFKALTEKNEPKKIVKYENDYKCPICGHWIGFRYTHCDGCGQKLDWE